MKEKPIHEGHRSRMRERYLKSGLNGFQSHEILEMILYYAIPRKNTNPTAHALLQRFGSLEKVFAAEPGELEKVPGMTENAALMLRMMRDLYQMQTAEDQQKTALDSGQRACDFFRRLYRFEQREIVRLAFLDENLYLKKCIVLSEGHPTAATVSVRDITEAALAESCNIVILAHNHPNGTASPSDTDISTTRCTAQALLKNGIILSDHIIVGTDKTRSLRECGTFLGII
ncbi:MAG: RadC family protein [Oscillospiraceae bacterium]|nr:RadC family protein [Oscillospiraceae bacterium]